MAQDTERKANSLFVTVDFDDSLTSRQAVRRSYKGVALIINYGLSSETRTFTSGDFRRDWDHMLTVATSIPNFDDINFMASSMVDAWMHQSGASRNF